MHANHDVRNIILQVRQGFKTSLAKILMGLMETDGVVSLGTEAVE